MSALHVQGVAKRFGATVALEQVDVLLRPGEVHALIGENGAGKSTLMNIVAGAVHPDRGTMRIDDAPYAPASPLEARRRGVALIHQELSLCPHLSVTENVLLGLEPARWGWIDAGTARRRTAALLDHFARPDLDPGRWASCRSPASRWSRSAAPSPPMRASSSWTSRRAACSARRWDACST